MEVNAERTLQNLDLIKGLVPAEAVRIALAQCIGRDAAHHLIEQCCRRAIEQGAHLRQVLGADPQVAAQLSAEELDRLLDPAHYLDQSHRWVQRAVAEHHAFNHAKGS